MRNPVVDLFLVRIGFVVSFADTFGDDFGVAFLMACVLAISALHACRILQEIPTKGTTHHVVELLPDELVTLLFVDLFLLLSKSTLSI